MAKGRKTCPNCNEEIHARLYLCPKCAWSFLHNEVRKDLLDKKNKPKRPLVYKSKGKGRKQCPDCSTIIPAVLKFCSQCGFDFVALIDKKKAELDEKRKKKLEAKHERMRKAALKAQKRNDEKIAALKPSIQEMLKVKYKPVPKLTPLEHAERILSYGKYRATMLLKHSKGRWSHVDWKHVALKLGVKDAAA